MKISVFIIFLFSVFSNGIAQTIPIKKLLIDSSQPIFDFNKDDIIVDINPNDITYLRILNGIILSDDFFIEEFDHIRFISDIIEIKKLGIKTNKSLMIVNKTFDVELKINNVLYSRPEFLKNYKYPLYIQLPISINEKLLFFKDKGARLPTLTFDKIKNIKYINSSESITKYGSIVPFGLIELELK